MKHLGMGSSNCIYLIDPIGLPIGLTIGLSLLSRFLASVALIHTSESEVTCSLLSEFSNTMQNNIGESIGEINNVLLYNDYSDL